ncbi:MAG: hypothetical protein AAF517_22560 [Planctomycetota bacterium]
MAAIATSRIKERALECFEARWVKWTIFLTVFVGTWLSGMPSAS